MTEGFGVDICRIEVAVSRIDDLDHWLNIHLKRGEVRFIRKNSAPIFDFLVTCAR